MPGRFFLDLAGPELAGQLKMDGAAITAEQPRQNIAPGQNIITWTSDGLTLMRWGIIPVGRVNARGRPVMETLINARSETVFDKSAYVGVGRAVVPVSGWYEWTGEKRKKTAWRIRAKDGGLLYFAAVTDIWRAPGGLEVPQVATVTCPPNGDVAPIHHRMGVILSPANVTAWLTESTQAVAPLMVPWPDGLLLIKEATGVDWDGP